MTAGPPNLRAGRLRHMRALPALLLLAACGDSAGRPPVPVTGPGHQRMEMRAIETTGRTGRIVLGLTQGSIRACSGSYEPPGSASPTRTTELSCTGGVTGRATVSADSLGGRSVQWELDTGERGQVRI